MLDAWQDKRPIGETTAPPPAAFVSALPPRRPRRCRANGCQALGEYPGICDDCARLAAKAAAEVRVRAWTRTLPEVHQDVTWDALPSLRRHDGTPRVSLARYTPETWAALRQAMERCPRAVLTGLAGNGKSSVAVAYLRAAVERDPSARVRFVGADELASLETPDGKPSAMATALSAEVLVLDDLGAELQGAPVGGGLLAQRIGPASKVIAERFERRLPLVVTPGVERDQIGAFYGERIARRVYEGASVIRLGGTAR